MDQAPGGGDLAPCPPCVINEGGSPPLGGGVFKDHHKRLQKCTLERHVTLKELLHSQVLEEGGTACGAGAASHGDLRAGSTLSRAGGAGERTLGLVPLLGSGWSPQARDVSSLV